MWRAIRLVVDTGLHAKGWTEQQAIDFFMANSPEPLESVTSEVRRYIVLPAQATTYKIGCSGSCACDAWRKNASGSASTSRAFTTRHSAGAPFPSASSLAR